MTSSSSLSSSAAASASSVSSIGIYTGAWFQNHKPALVAFFIILFGYITTSLLLNSYFYYYRGVGVGLGDGIALHSMAATSTSTAIETKSSVSTGIVKKGTAPTPLELLKAKSGVKAKSRRNLSPAKTATKKNKKREGVEENEEQDEQEEQERSLSENLLKKQQPQHFKEDIDELNQGLSWKIQPRVGVHRTGKAIWGMPFFSQKPDRAPGHWYLTSFNLLMASCFGAFVTECCSKGLWYSKMNFDEYSEYGIGRILIELIIAITHESVVEYYWHRTMHSKLFYATFHKLHHSYKSPEPFDDMYIHPLEAFGYYCILYSPPFVYSCHCYSFILYMIFMGVCGIMDHSGIHFHIPLLYNTSDHDAHHSKFDVNYGFPFVFMDILHGTFEGSLLGWQFTANNKLD